MSQSEQAAVRDDGPSAHDPRPQLRQEPFARVLYGLIAAVALVALILSLRNGWLGPSGVPDDAGYSHVFPAGWQNALNQFAYFTFMSNLLVCISATWLALKPRSNSGLLQVLNISALACIMVTGIVFNFLLRSDDPMTGLQRFHDTLQHIFTPIAFPLVWLIFGPVGRISWRRIAWAVVIPLAWLVTTLVRGELIDWYPYSILDVPKHGYGYVMSYIGGILVLFVLLAAALWAIDRSRARATNRGTAEQTPAK